MGLGLVLWYGSYEDVEADWLRWCDQDGNLIMTGAERAAAAEKRTKSAEERAERLEAQLRKLGADPTA